jgi:cephalosporin-C deacetylase-like acetyl esterase
MLRVPIAIWAGLLSLATCPALAQADEAADKALAARLRELDEKDLKTQGDVAKSFPQMLFKNARLRRDAANRRDFDAWKAVQSRADWERFRAPRLRALAASLGTFPPAPRDLKVRVSGTLEGEGHRIEKLVFESRPGLWVTANLYLPTKAERPLPAFLLCHSHHNPKTQGELQDMGVTWARQGCAVLVMDQLGHGERRQHPFVNEKSYPGRFRPSRQDYHFRYNEGLQLSLIGDSLIGWMVWDLRRGIDLLSARPGVDKDRIILLGAVAGGGDPAAVVAALDDRVAAVAPFNFGGPQPETTFPLPADPERRFNYVGGGSWESTRNLPLSARGGFLPWVIVGSAAPRRLIYAHEFAWDREHDPVWKRLQKIYALYKVPENLVSVHGRGSVRGNAGPENTHCNNIGPVHRQQIYPALKRWFGLPIPGKEAWVRRTAAELACLTPALAREVKPRPLWQLARELGRERAEAARKRRAALEPAEQRAQLRRDWSRLLGETAFWTKPRIEARETRRIGEVTLERILLDVEPGIHVPLLLLLPAKAEGRLPVVIGVAQQGKAAFLKERSSVLAKLLAGKVAVCLPDVRGTGETRPRTARGRQSGATSLSATELMLGQTLLGSRLRDLLSVVHFLRGRTDLDPRRVLLWGDSFAPVNAPDAPLAVPLDTEKLPHQAEPLGGLLALLGALFDEDVRGVCVRGGLVSYESLLRGHFLYVPHDCVVPGALTVGDLGDVAAVLAPRPLWLGELVDGVNRRVSADTVQQALASARTAYRTARATEQLRLGDDDLAGWMIKQLRR